jgi:hypothetical protein
LNIQQKIMIALKIWSLVHTCPAASNKIMTFAKSFVKWQKFIYRFVPKLNDEGSEKSIRGGE